MRNTTAAAAPCGNVLTPEWVLPIVDRKQIMPTRLILARHGESTVNVIHLASDDHENNPLTPRGVEQASVLATWATTNPITVVYTSPTQRARETGAIVAQRLGLAPVVEWGLEEIRVGVHEGERGSVALARGTADFRRWLLDADLDHGYEGGETGHQVAARLADALRRIVARHVGETVFVASHGCALAFTIPLLCDNIDLPSLYHRQLDNCDVVEVVVDGDHWTCTMWAGVHPDDFDMESVA